MATPTGAVSGRHDIKAALRLIQHAEKTDQIEPASCKTDIVAEQQFLEPGPADQKVNEQRP